MTLLGVRVNVLFSFWHNGFYTAMQNLDAKAFWFMVVVFVSLAGILVAHALLNTYLQQAFQIRWRVWLTNSLIERWLENQSYYRSLFVKESADNPDQRIQQDVEGFVNTSLSLSMGLLGAAVSLFAFSIILWNLSGSYYGQPATDGRTIYAGNAGNLVAISETPWKMTWQPAVLVLTVIIAMIGVAMLGGRTPRLE